MRFANILTFILVVFISIGLGVQAEEVTQDKAVVSVTLETQTQVFYYDSVTDAVNKAKDNTKSTLKLLTPLLWIT